MNKGGFLARQKAERDWYMVTAERITRQLMVDSLQIAIHEKGWGYDRLKALMDRWSENYDELYDVLDASNPECDVKRHHLDEAIRDIVKDHQEFIPFDGRYPDVKRINYNKRR